MPPYDLDPHLIPMANAQDALNWLINESKGLEGEYASCHEDHQTWSRIRNKAKGLIQIELAIATIARTHPHDNATG